MQIFQSAIIIFTIFIMGVSFSNAQEKNDKMLIGIITSLDLQKGPYAEWYNEFSNDYQVDNTSLEGLNRLMEGVEVKIVMGTWCHDSKREVPRFYKIFSTRNIPEAQVEMIALNRKKQSPNAEIYNMAITNTPTFIFYKNGEELNRIVETPVESLEKDLVKILKGQAYRNSKMLE